MLLQGGAERLLAMAQPRQPAPLPQRLDRRRIYVLPTPFGLFVGALLAAMLLGALNYNNNPALLLALLLAGAAIASTLSAHLALSGLTLESLSAEPVPAGQPLRLRLTLSQRGHRSRPGLRVDHQACRGWVHVPAEGRVEAELHLPTEHRGWLDLQRIRVSTTQPLGLVRAWGWFWPEHPLLVYPQPELHGPGLPERGSDPLHSRMDPAGEELHQLRAYRSGDARRSIAWKHSARRDTLLVREYEKPVGIEVVLDWSDLPGLETERRIARLARWVDLAEQQGRRYSLRLPGQPPLGPALGPAHHHACLRALALLPHG